MPQPVKDETTDVEEYTVGGEHVVIVTKYSDTTKLRVISKEERRFPDPGGDWDHFVRRDFTHWLPDGTMIGETDRVGGDPPKKSKTITVYGYERVEFPGSSYFRGTTVAKAKITLHEDGTISVTIFTEHDTSGSPTKGITIPVSPPGPPQAWSAP